MASGKVVFSSSEITGPASQVFKAFQLAHDSMLCPSCSRAFRGLPPAHKAHAPCASSFRGSAEPDPNSFEAFLLASSHHHHPPSHPAFSLLSPTVYTMPVCSHHSCHSACSDALPSKPAPLPPSASCTEPQPEVSFSWDFDTDIAFNPRSHCLGIQ